MKLNVAKVFGKKKIFLSYESSRSSDAAVIEEFFKANKCQIVRDTNVKDSFWEFMDEIESCDCVIMLLNGMFFESPFCTYELVWSYACNKKIYPIWFSGLNVSSEDERQRCYGLIQQKDINITPEQKKRFREELSSFDKYEEIILKLLSEVRYFKDGQRFMDACNDIYTAICHKKAKVSMLENESKIRSIYLHDLDVISDEALRTEFMWLIGDLKRCSSFRTSLFAEDPFGEKEWVFNGYSILKESIGFSFLMNVLNEEEKEEILAIHNICGLVFNTSSCGSDYVKYYIETYDRELYKEYLYQKGRPEAVQDKLVISRFYSNGKKRQRITLLFRDNNVFDCIHLKR